MTTMSVQPQHEDLDVERAALEVLKWLQRAIRELIQSTPGPKERPKDLKATLGIPYKLAWQIHTLAHAADPVSQAGNVPGPTAIARFAEAAARRGAPADAVASVDNALKRYERLVSTHGGSRSAFDSIISGMSQAGATQADLTSRRAVFNGQSHLLGIHADTHLACYICNQNATNPGLVDVINIRGLIGLRRFRRDVSWVVSTSDQSTDKGEPPKHGTVEPLAPPAEASMAGLIPQFCSQPTPVLKRTEHPLGITNVEVEPNGVGAQSSISCLLGHVYRGMSPRYRDESFHSHRNGVRVRTPCKVLVLDTLVRSALFQDSSPTAAAYTDHRVIGATNMIGRECDRLPLRETVTFLGRGREVLGTNDVPQYEQLIRYAMDRTGWDIEEFDVYRLRIEYPAMPSSVVVHFDLPEKP